MSGLAQWAGVFLFGVCVFAGFVLMGRFDQKILAGGVFALFCGLALWLVRSYARAETDVDLIVTGLAMFGAILLVGLAGSGWFVGRMIRQGDDR